MTVRQRIDELISASIDEIEGGPPTPPQPDGRLPTADCSLEAQDLAAQVRELTTQAGALVSILRKLQEV
jgi:hypothetical protein